MQRIPCDERADWRETAEKVDFQFHTIDGERYWDERAYYAFTLKEIEEDLEAATAELHDSNGCGSSRRSSGRSFPAIPTSIIRCTNA
jgi:Glutathionylspermidine synthase preATP-grasp